MAEATSHPESAGGSPDREASQGHRARAAIKAWTAALGEEQVSANPAMLDRYGRTSQASAPRPSCVVHPRSTADVQEVVRIASQHGVVLYPISRGKNWGYGDACAPTPGAAIVDLSEMDQILEVNTELAYCVIEPGVSQGQLYNYLQENQTGLWMDVTGAGPESSIVGNTLDRGFGSTRYSDHFNTCCGMEIVLANGRVLNTGFGHYANVKATNVYRYGVGPFLDGLFCQSNFGIVTKIGLYLMPKPEAYSFYYFQVPRREDICALVERLRPLRIAGILDTPIRIGNDIRVLSGSGTYPWELAKGRTPMPAETLEALRKETSARAWQGCGSFTGTGAHVRAGHRALRKALRGLCKPKFVTDRRLAMYERGVNALNAVGLGAVASQRLQLLKPNYELLKGIPSIEPLMGTQWRLRNPPESGACDPLDANCGVYWISPVLPMKGDNVLEVIDLVEPICLKHGFDMGCTIALMTERSAIAVINMTFDKTVAGESEQASACYEALMAALADKGYMVYRCGLQGMETIRRERSVFWDVARQLKQSLDPQDIIARGRYLEPLDDAD